MKKKDDTQQPNPIREGTSNKADIHPGSTTQGGSNFGQGSYQLGKEANKQGSEANSGASYANEQGWDNESLRTTDNDTSGAHREDPSEKTENVSVKNE